MFRRIFSAVLTTGKYCWNEIYKALFIYFDVVEPAKPGEIRSLLDVDLYKLTMLQSIWKRHRDNVVTFAFKNRTKRVKLANYVNKEELLERLNDVRNLRFRSFEIEYLRTLGLFSNEFLEFLPTLELAPINLEVVDGDYKIEVTGKWPEVTLWETILLSVQNELYFAALTKERGVSRWEAWEEGKKRLERKTRDMNYFGLGNIIEFGTRRRFSRAWQDYVVWYLARNALKSILGTSNVFLAMKYNLRPIGTFAHEMFMGEFGIFRANGSKNPARDSQRQVLEDWWEDYGEKLSIALTDNYGSKFFFDNFTKELALKYRGVRHDSGDPFEFGEMVIDFYKRQGIDPTRKLMVFSDGLDFNMISDLTERFEGRIGLAFGWGTNLTNDMGFDALSIVAKLIRSAGFGTVKTSDNLAKATGEKEDIEMVVAEVGYQGTNRVECRY